MPSFSNKKALKFIVTLGTGTFDDAGDNQIILQGFRATADISKAGGVQMSTLRANIFGVRRQDMDAITTLQWKPGSYIPNTVEVFAIDGDVETLVFAGNIVNAWADYQSVPDVFLMIQAQAAFYGQVKSSTPRSFKGSADVATIMSQIADGMKLSFENNGVNVQLSDVYLANTDNEQAKALADMAGISMYIDDKTLAIAPLNAPRSAQIIPRISADSGLVGYPTFDGIGVNFNVLFTPGILFGGLVKLDTEVTRAAGEWIVVSMSHKLDAEKPGGSWFSTIRGNANGLAITSR